MTGRLYHLHDMGLSWVAGGGLRRGRSSGGGVGRGSGGGGRRGSSAGAGDSVRGRRGNGGMVCGDAHSKKKRANNNINSYNNNAGGKPTTTTTNNDRVYSNIVYELTPLANLARGRHICEIILGRGGMRSSIFGRIMSGRRGGCSSEGSSINGGGIIGSRRSTAVEALC